jgi:hypothetical protein
LIASQFLNLLATPTVLRRHESCSLIKEGMIVK